ncbi:hypothetical protein [Belnapia rosea]|uniref:Uncharacterized protein n=1 Tax=Belnapia rosea TaxID=938405 RepID=A0A1G6V8Q4_9PROT|nr:hypothetical protein [Belnapia rosea]SDD49216.1 hypothetical protein SAMN04487779_1008150 [Belnapia rosea]
MPDKESTRPGHVSSPLARPDGQPPVVPGADGAWLLELSRGPGGRFEFFHERVGGIVRVTGQAVLRHPAGNVVQPVTVVMRDEDAGELGAGVVGILGS